MRRLAVLLAALAAFFAIPAQASFSPLALNDVETWLAQRPAKVRCLTKRESENDLAITLGAEAYVNVAALGGGPENVTTVAYPWCKVALERDYADPDFLIAVFILTHEAGHLRGGHFPLWYDEAQVNCWALRRTVAVAVIKFGMPTAMMDAARAFLNTIYAHQPSAYHWKDCAHGG